MSEPFTTWRKNVAARWLDYFSHFNNMSNHFVALGDQIAANNWAGAEVQCDLLAVYAIKLRDEILGSSGFRTNMNNMFVELEDLLDEPPAEVDMAAILNAMLAATFDELRTFVGISDAYRTAIWEAPFNQEYYAALARGFREWGVE